MPILEPARRVVRRRLGPRTVDIAVIAVSAYLTVAGSDGPGAWSPFPRPVAVAAGLAGSLALWWRRRWPVPTTLATAAAVALSANPIPAVVAVFGLATRRRDAPAAAAVAATIAGVAVPEWVDAARVDARALVTGAALVALPVVAGAYVGIRHDLMVSLRDRAERAEAHRELLLAQAKLGERARIAREMHDVLAHKVSLIALHAGALEVSPGAGEARVEETAGVIRTTAAQALDELRSVLGVLRTDAALDDLAPQPQTVDIARLVDASRAAGVPATLHGGVPELPDAMARTVHRVVQEALTNVHKHAPHAATAVTVEGDEAHGVAVTVRNGPASSAASPLPGSGAGLVGLGERMRLVGGTLAHGPAPDGAWQVTAWLPWAGTADRPDGVEAGAGPIADPHEDSAGAPGTSEASAEAGP